MAPDIWNKQRSTIASFYDGRVQQHGISYQACDWGRRESQMLRFTIMLESLRQTPRRVLDVGCGLADFADVLGEAFPTAHYTGVDISSGMVEAARGHRPDLDIRCADILDGDLAGAGFDLVVASGIFSRLTGDAMPTMKRLLARMFEMTSETLVFTSLSSWSGGREEEDFYADPLQVLDYCRSLSPLLSLRHDYLPHDFTLALHKPQAV